MKVNFISEYKKFTGKENMEMDLDMLNSAIVNKSTDYSIRFYGWAPKCISLGRNQKDFDTNVTIDKVRRPTGGRALLHDMEITYAIAGKIPEKQSIIETYKMISDVFIEGFKTLGIELEIAGEISNKSNYCMNISSGADICYKNKKLIGAAQFRKENYFLQHGSILKDIDVDFFEKVFSEKIETNKITTIKEIAPNLTDEEIINSIKEAFLRQEK